MEGAARRRGGRRRPFPPGSCPSETRFCACAVRCRARSDESFCFVFWAGKAGSGLVVGGRVLARQSGVDPLQNEFRGLGPGGLQVAGVGVAVAALLAAAAGRVRLDVLAQVVAAHEALVAHRAREPFLAGVRAQVSLQLVGASEAFPAEKPVADERPLAGVPPQVRLQVGRLPVHLPAAGDVAAVESLPPQAGPGGAQALCLLTVRAVTCCSAGVAPGRPGGAADPRAAPRNHGVGGRSVRVGGDDRFEAVLRQQVLAGGQQVGRRGADARGAERRVGQRGEVRVVAAQLGVDGLRCSGVQGGLEAAGGALHVEPRAGVRVDVPPRRRAVGHVARQGRVEAGLVPRLVRVRHSHARVQSLRRRVHFGDEGRLSGFLRRDAGGVGEQAAVLGGEGGRGRGGGGEAEGAVAAAAAGRNPRGRAARRHRETGQARAQVAAGRGPFPRVEPALGERAGVG